MLQTAQTNKFEYTKVSPEEQKQRKILGRLAGIMADFKHPTRNDRLYTEALWDKVFNDPIMQEKLQTRTLFGELGHPLEDRSEIDMEKIAICLAEEPKKYPDGTVKGVFDILDTPNGRILKTLCDYGCQIGVSSRGQGDVVEDWSTGKEKVDPSTYQCECWDAVLLPAVKTARMTALTESLNEDTKLKNSLMEAIKGATPEAKKVMVETLKRLKIDYSPEKVDNKQRVEVTESIAAEDNGAGLIQNLQETIKQNKLLQDQVRSLQEKLSVCNAKEAKLVEENLSYKAQVEAQASKDELIKSLNEQLTQTTQLVDKQTRKLDILSEKLTKQKATQESLRESVQSESKLKTLNEQLRKQSVENQREIEILNESLEDLKKDSSLVKQECQKKLQKAQSLVEHYKQIALAASDKYIAARAKMIGVKPADIKCKLHESFSFNDVDRVCEDLQAYQLRVGSLPFGVSSGDKIKVSIKESKEPVLSKSRFDDEIDETLMRLANK